MCAFRSAHEEIDGWITVAPKLKFPAAPDEKFRVSRFKYNQSNFTYSDVELLLSLFGVLGSAHEKVLRFNLDLDLDLDSKTRDHIWKKLKLEKYSRRNGANFQSSTFKIEYWIGNLIYAKSSTYFGIHYICNIDASQSDLQGVSLSYTNMNIMNSERTSLN